MKIFITLDYELFLGDNTGTPLNSIIKPMNRLCEIAERNSVQFVVFVDAAYLLRLSQLKSSNVKLYEDYEKVTDNLKLLVESGHDVQLHFHPQWLYSDYNSNTGQWILKINPYKLSDMEVNDVFGLFHDSKALLDGIIGYRTTAFRAGGYCLTSFSQYQTLFRQEGIIIDSSVARGCYVDSPVHYYDYRRIPDNHIYQFNDDVCVEMKNGPFTELSISSVHWSSLFYLTKVRPLMSSYKPSLIYGDGKSVSDGPKKNKFINLIERIIKPYNNLVSIDGIRSCQLEIIFQELKHKGVDTLVMIGHPKLSTDASLAFFDSFINNHRNELFCTTKNLL